VAAVLSKRSDATLYAGTSSNTRETRAVLGNNIAPLVCKTNGNVSSISPILTVAITSFLKVGYCRPYSTKNDRGILPRGIAELSAKVSMNYWKALRPLLVYSSALSTDGAVSSSGQDLEHVDMVVNPPPASLKANTERIFAIWAIQ
jgi:hypothetical protein